jgi:hypothetical protein
LAAKNAKKRKERDCVAAVILPRLLFLRSFAFFAADPFCSGEVSAKKTGPVSRWWVAASDPDG